MSYGPQSGISAQSVTAAESASVIRDGIGQAEQWVSDLHGLVDQLEKRLTTVLSPSQPMPDSAGTAKSPTPQSHVTGRLQILNEGYAHLASKLNDILRRVEV